ncbi:MAG: type II toxin-antitoxin system prevent-host-death family antitoxin [Hyphomicrobiales bacterium]
MNKHSRVWSLQEAKAKFSEVVRRAQAEGPQTVTVHGKAAVTITAAGAAGHPAETGAGLVEILNKSPLRLLSGKNIGRVKATARNRPIDL